MNRTVDCVSRSQLLDHRATPVPIYSNTQFLTNWHQIVYNYFYWDPGRVEKYSTDFDDSSKVQIIDISIKSIILG